MAGDTCPYPRPFPEHFAECVAFQPIRFEPVDTQHRPLQESWTCRQLDIGKTDAGRFYARCRLGDAESRRAWAARMGERSQHLQRLRRLLATGVEPELNRFLSLQRSEAGSEERNSELEAAGDQLVAAMHRCLGENVELLDKVGLSRTTAAAILREMVSGWVASRVPIDSLEAPPELIARYREARDLLAPD